jgi:hypothetical protein
VINEEIHLWVVNTGHWSGTGLSSEGIFVLQAVSYGACPFESRASEDASPGEHKTKYFNFHGWNE